MQQDVKDFRENLSDHEKKLVGNILLGFAQTECAVSDYWTNQVTRWFPKHEIIQMAMMFGSQETIHATAYSYLNETLGLENFDGFLHNEVTKNKFDNLMNTKNDYTYVELATMPLARVEVAKSLAVFSAFAEGVSLYSSFAVLYSFQMRNLLKGIGQQMKWSVRDESLHSKMGCMLFRQMCEEYSELRDAAREKILEAAHLSVNMEIDFINKMFENGDLENLKAEDLVEFIRKRANEKLIELGYEPVFIVDTTKSDNLDWFYHLTGGLTHTDFFALRPTDYSKAGEGEDFEDVWH